MGGVIHGATLAARDGGFAGTPRGLLWKRSEGTGMVGTSLRGWRMTGHETANQGLTSTQVHEQRVRFGENRLPQQQPVSAGRILLNQVASPLSYVVLAAAGISLALGELGDFVLISIVVIVDVALGFIQEYQASRTYSALRALLKPTATVLRAEGRVEIEVWELVPGDLVLLARGDKVPADGTLLEATELSIDESVLTGESEAVRKVADAGTVSRESSAFMGTTILTGRGLMYVTTIGTATELGSIAVSLSEDVDAPTPLQVRLEEFSRQLTRVVLVATIVILISGVALGRGFLEMLRTSIILAIATVPAGLLIAVTVILALGMRRILTRQGLVKRLLAVETLGSVTVICTDKTGTLTEGHMQVSRVDATNEQVALHTMLLCNNLDGPVDLALWEYASAKVTVDVAEFVAEWARVAEQPFSSESKRMIVSVASIDGTKRLLAKGAPEVVLSMCSVDSAEQDRIRREVESWATDGLRMIALAEGVTSDAMAQTGYEWVGLVGLQDPLRPQVPGAVQLAQRAGVEINVVTGDYSRTALSIAHAAGITSDAVLEGDALSRLTDTQLQQRMRDTHVFARVHPQDKLRIVRALQGNGEVVAMIGDGVNDAPALTHADIGVVVGGATDIAKESADLILLDSNFATIVAAIEEGRVIFDNIRKVIAYVLSNSFAAVLTVFLAMMLGWPTPLLVAQILWINLICDGPSDIVLGFEPGEEGVMRRKPCRMHQPVLDRLGIALIAVVSSCSAAFALAAFGYCHVVLNDTELGRSMVFASFAVNSMIYIFGFRSMHTPLTRMSGAHHNKPLLAAVVGGVVMAVLPFVVPSMGQLIGVVPLMFVQWLLVFAFALALLALVELVKAVARRFT